MNISTLLFEPGAPLQVPVDFKILSVKVVESDPRTIEMAYGTNSEDTKWIDTELVNAETDLSERPLCDGSYRIPDSQYFMWWNA